MQALVALEWLAAVAHHAGLALILGVLAFILHVFAPDQLEDLLAGWRRTLRLGATLHASGLSLNVALAWAMHGQGIVDTLRGRALLLLWLLAGVLLAQTMRAERFTWPWQRVLKWALPLVAAPVALAGLYGNTVRAGIPFPVAWAARSLHLGASLTWIGALFLLLAVLAKLRAWNPHAHGALGGVSERFSQLSFTAISLLAVTGALMANLLAGPMTTWAGTSYGTILLVKLGLSAAMVALAFANRFGHVLAYRRGHGRDRVPKYARNVAYEVLLGLAVVALAAWMARLGPG